MKLSLKFRLPDKRVKSYIICSTLVNNELKIVAKTMQLCFGLVMGYWGKSVSGQTPHLKYFSLLIGGKVLLVYKTH